MRCGLFGKIERQTRFHRDRDAAQFSRSLGAVGAGLAVCKPPPARPDWQKAFLTAPVWRFWLGAAICGATVAGAIMPSLDGVGRYYPLTLHAVTDADALLPPPGIDPQDEWFAAAEEFLLSTLDRAATFEQISAALDRLALPRLQASHARGCRTVHRVWAQRGLGVLSDVGAFAQSFTALAAANPHVQPLPVSGGPPVAEGFPPMALACRGLPDPFHYSTLLTGDLGRRSIRRPNDARWYQVPSLFDVGSVTHPDGCETRNEDSCLVRTDVGLWAVADGMGGHEAGDLASRIVVKSLDDNRHDRTPPPTYWRNARSGCSSRTRQILTLSRSAAGRNRRYHCGDSAHARRLLCLHMGRRQPGVPDQPRRASDRCRAITPRSRN